MVDFHKVHDCTGCKNYIPDRFAKECFECDRPLTHNCSNCSNFEMGVPNVECFDCKIMLKTRKDISR